MNSPVLDPDDWLRGLIGKPWSPMGRGPDTFDCWGLVFWIYRDYLGIRLSLLPNLDPKNLLEVRRTAKDQEAFWCEIPTPVDFCLVAMSKHRAIHHVGIYIHKQGLVLHCMDGSAVIAQNFYSLRASGFETIRFYKLSQ